MILPDVLIMAAIRDEKIKIAPWRMENVQPASVDLHLHDVIQVYGGNMTAGDRLDLRKPADSFLREHKLTDDVPYWLNPGQFILASTEEWITLSSSVVARLEGKSSLGRVGLDIHATAGYVDPGWDGRLTLEISNKAPIPVSLYAGMPVCQISFIEMAAAALRPYGSSSLNSKYQGQTKATGSLYYKEFEHDC